MRRAVQSPRKICEFGGPRLLMRIVGRQQPEAIEVFRDIPQFGADRLQVGGCAADAIAALGDLGRLHVGQDRLRGDDHLIGVIDEILRRPLVLREPQPKARNHRKNNEDRNGKSGQNTRREQS